MAVNVECIKALALQNIILSSEFTADNGDWTKGTGWTVDAGNSNRADAVAATGSLSQTVAPLTSGISYRTRIIVGATGADKIVVVCGTQAGTARGSGNFYEDIAANGTGYSIRPATVGEGGTGVFTGWVDSALAVALRETFSFSGFGTPKAATFESAGGVVDVESSGGAISFGLTDGTRQYCVMGGSESGVTTSDSYRRISNTGCIGFVSSSDGTIQELGSFHSFTTDSVTINWMAGGTFIGINGIGLPLNITLFGGSDLSAYAIDVTSHPVKLNAVTVTPGFLVDNVCVLTHGSLTAFNTTGDGMKLGVGFADRGSATFISLNMLSTDNVATTDIRNLVASAAAASQPSDGPAITIGTGQEAVTVSKSSST